MKNLILIRHGKSSWEAPLNDKDRPLISRGILDAHFVAEKTIPYLPKTFIIWSSTAKRASETALIFTQTFSCPIESIIITNAELTGSTVAGVVGIRGHVSRHVDCHHAVGGGYHIEGVGGAAHGHKA